MNSAVFSIPFDCITWKNKHSVVNQDTDFSPNENEWKLIVEQTGP